MRKRICHSRAGGNPSFKGIFWIPVPNRGLPLPLNSRVWGAFAGMTVILAICSWGLFRLHHPLSRSSAPSLKVCLLQGNIDQYKKWDKTYVAEIQENYEQLVAEAARSKPDLIIWPETSVPGYLLQEPPLRTWLEKVVRQSRTNHLIGAPALHGESAYNSAFSINHEGNLEDEYAKHHLVPFGEVVPWVNILGRWIRVLNDLGGFTAGQGPSVLMAGGYPIGVNICYEAIFPNLVRESVKQGAQLLANLTNDGWYMRTAAPNQHLIPNVFRAIENDRWVMRADNTGVSALIDPSGRIQAASAIFETTIVQGTVEPRTHLTFYTRHGDWFAWLCCLLTLCLLAAWNLFGKVPV